jgi:hypothetical protein
MSYRLPDPDELGKFAYLLTQTLRMARLRAYQTDPQLAELLDAVESLPDLLLRYPDLDEAALREQLEELECKYPEWSGRFSGILRDGAPDDWQLTHH